MGADVRFLANMFKGRYEKTKIYFLSRLPQLYRHIDKNGEQAILDLIVRTFDVSVYKIEHDSIKITTAAGANTILIRPKEGEVWLLDRVNLSQADTQKRVFSIGYALTPDDERGILMALYPETHVTIANGGPGVEQTVFPIWHDISGGVEQDHVASVGPPLQLDFNNYVQLVGLGFTADKQITAKWQYRRIK